MMTLRWSHAALFTSALVVALPGCGQSVPPPPEETLVPVTGTVTVGGKPASGVSVLFIPEGSTGGNG